MVTKLDDIAVKDIGEKNLLVATELKRDPVNANAS